MYSNYLLLVLYLILFIFFFPESVSMSGRRSAKLLVIVSQDDSRKLLLPDGIPESEDELIEKVREAFGLNGRFRLQYQDKDFGDIFVNLTNTGEIQSLGTLKIIPLPDEDSFTAQTNDGTQSNDDALSSVGSGDTDDTIILSPPGSETVSIRNQQWPKEFDIPRFSYDTELQLERGNALFKVNGTRLTVTPKMKSDILEKVCDEIYKYKSYPSIANFCEVSIREKMTKTFAIRRQEIVENQPSVHGLQERWPALFQQEEVKAFILLKNVKM